MEVRGTTAEGDVSVGMDMLVGDEELEGTGKLVGEIVLVGNDVLGTVDALSHPATVRTSAQAAIHKV